MKIIINEEISEFGDCFLRLKDGRICYAQPKEHFIELLKVFLKCNRINYITKQDESNILSIESSSKLLLS